MSKRSGILKDFVVNKHMSFVDHRLEICLFFLFFFRFKIYAASQRSSKLNTFVLVVSVYNRLWLCMLNESAVHVCMCVSVQH